MVALFNKKGQISMEYLFIVSIATLIAIPLIVLFFTQMDSAEESLTVTQVNRIAETIVNSADEVYYLGEPTKRTVNYYMPNHVENISLSGKNLTIILVFDSNSFSLRKYSKANLIGNITNGQGAHTIELIAQNQTVIIREKGS